MFFEDGLGDGATEVLEPMPGTKTTPFVAHLAVAVALTKEHIMSDLKDELEKTGKTKAAKNKAILQEHLIDAINSLVSETSVTQ